MFCQYTPGKYFLGSGPQTGPQTLADAGTALTIILLVVFAASLAAGLLFLLGARRHARRVGAEKEPRTRIAVPPPPEKPDRLAPDSPRPNPSIPMPAQPEAAIPATAAEYTPPAATPPPVIKRKPAGRPYGPQVTIDIIGDGIETALDGLDKGIFFIFAAFIKVFKWISRIDRQQ